MQRLPLREAIHTGKRTRCGAKCPVPKTLDRNKWRFIRRELIFVKSQRFFLRLFMVDASAGYLIAPSGDIRSRPDLSQWDKSVFIPEMFHTKPHDDNGQWGPISEYLPPPDFPIHLLSFFFASRFLSEFSTHPRATERNFLRAKEKSLIFEKPSHSSHFQVRSTLRNWKKIFQSRQERRCEASEYAPKIQLQAMRNCARL